MRNIECRIRAEFRTLAALFELDEIDYKTFENKSLEIINKCYAEKICEEGTIPIFMDYYKEHFNLNQNGCKDIKDESTRCMLW